MNTKVSKFRGWTSRWAMLLSLLCWVVAPSAQAQTILSTKHNLSISSPGTIKAVAESEVCIFCHTPHKAVNDLPLWNHSLSYATYTPYQSSTAKAVIGQPTGASKLCLSCHDGTVALGMVNSRATAIQMQGGVSTMPAGRSRLGTDLSDDHPISFVYDSALATADGQLKDPATLGDKARLDSARQLQCTSCHDPHNNQYGRFLVQDNYASGLCINCHNINYWQSSIHRTSVKTWNGVGQNPWPHTSYQNVAANGCENCHAPHTAGTRQRLLNFADEEQNCYSCHSGNVAEENIQAEFGKTSLHPILRTSAVHDPAENPINPTRHVECADCHNAHAANASLATVPNASGALAGLTGVTDTGTLITPLTREYELCYRCHADSLNRGPARVPRQFVETNKRLAFQASNGSFHPIAAIGKNQNVPSLLAPWTTSSRMYCTDCHNNDQGPGAGGTGPKGPHGSRYAPILEREYALVDNNVENFSVYALCYKCHDRNNLMADQSFKHHLHVSDVRASCATCHDPHGVASKPHLINFNTTYVTPSSNGRLEYNSTGTFRGNCSLRCHGEDHNATSYAP